MCSSDLAETISKTRRTGTRSADRDETRPPHGRRSDSCHDSRWGTPAAFTNRHSTCCPAFYPADRLKAICDDSTGTGLDASSI